MYPSKLQIETRLNMQKPQKLHFKGSLSLSEKPTDKQT